MIFPKNIDIPVKDLGGKILNADVLKYVPEDSAKHYKFIPIDLVDGYLEFGVLDPEDIEAREAISFIATRIGMPFKLFVISKTDYDAVMSAYQNLSGEVYKALGVLKEEEKAESADNSIEAQIKGMTKRVEPSMAEDAPITKIVSVIVQNAVEGRASDIHIEPTRDRVKVRFRVDGVLYQSLFLPLNVLEAVVARIKIIGDMKLDEKRKPQDGRFSANIGNRQVDFRVSTFPTYYGEKVVMRILDTGKGVTKLEDLGFTEEHLTAIKAALDKPYGLILLTGPTGSGKTTTLYSMLSAIDREENNVVSLEDPVEYAIEGVSQSQVRPEIDYTFVNGLRSILRQDPDIIMVGEIRDAETARLAIQAALTGHLVFSTLHTNTAVATIPRLIDMGIEPYLIAPTLIMAIGQRLVGKLCDESKGTFPTEGAIKTKIEKRFADLPKEYRDKIEIPDKVYTMQSSATCSTGSRGRVPVLEVLTINKEIQEVIFKNPTEEEVYKVARKNGMLTMSEDAIIKSFRGEVDFEEHERL